MKIHDNKDIEDLIINLRKLNNGATFGPWQHFSHSGCHISDIVGGASPNNKRSANVLPKVAEVLHQSDGEFICTVRNSLSTILDEAEKAIDLKSIIDGLRSQLIIANERIKVLEDEMRFLDQTSAGEGL